jgi:hypothetical protein
MPPSTPASQIGGEELAVADGDAADQAGSGATKDDAATHVKAVIHVHHARVVRRPGVVTRSS